MDRRTFFFYCNVYALTLQNLHRIFEINHLKKQNDSSICLLNSKYKAGTLCRPYILLTQYLEQNCYK